MSEVINYDADKDGRFSLKYDEGRLYPGGSTVYVENSFSELAPGAIKAGSVIPMYDATVDTVRSSKVKEVISLDQRDHLLYLWVLTDKNLEIKHSVNDGVEFSMRRDSDIEVSFKDKKRDDRVIVM